MTPIIDLVYLAIIVCTSVDGTKPRAPSEHWVIATASFHARLSVLDRRSNRQFYVSVFKGIYLLYIPRFTMSSGIV